MATLKHIASKNSDYTAIEAYLIYQHDEFTGKQLLDEQGKPKLRESYLLDTLECGDFSFATACLLANRKYGKNTQHAEKVNGVWEQRLRIHYNCVGTIEIPSALPLPTPDVSVNTRKGVVVNYAPCDVAI